MNMDVWKDTWPLRRNKRVGIEQVTFGLLWEIAEGRPGRIVVTAKKLQEGFQRDGSCLRDHLVKLARIGVIRLVARTRKTGEFLIDVYNPCPAHAEAIPDPQMLLPGMWTDGVDDLAPLVGNETQPAGDNSGGDAEGARRGEIPADQARGNPRDSGRGEIPVAKNTGNPAKNAGLSGRGEIPAGKSPRSNDNERENLNIYNGSTKTKDNVSNVVIPAGGDAGKSPHENPRGEVPADQAAAQLDREIAQRRAVDQTTAQLDLEIARRRADSAAERQPATESKVGELLFGVASARFSPAKQKEQLVARLRNLARDPGTKDWLFGFAADVILIHGQSSSRDDAGVILSKCEALLYNLSAHREMEQREGKKPKPLGKWLNKEIHTICDGHGIETPRSRKKKKAMVSA